MSNSKSPVVYEVCVCEISYGGMHGTPQYTRLTGAGAKGRALDFAQGESSRRSVTSVQVLRMRREQPDNRSRAAELYKFRNSDPVCPCNNPRCSSVWAAGKIRDERWYVSSLSVHTGQHVTRYTKPCAELRGCSGDAGWAVEGLRHGAGRKCVAEPTRYLTPCGSLQWCQERRRHLVAA